MRCCPRRLAQVAPEPDVSFACLPAEALAGTLIVSRTQARSAGEMLRGRKLLHVRADFRNQVGSGNRFNPGDRSAQIHTVRHVGGLGRGTAGAGVAGPADVAFRSRS